MAAMPALPSLTRRQLWTLITLTLVWGCNWPIMKMGVTGFPPLTFRFICLLIGTPVLGLGLWAMKVPFQIPRLYWRELLVLAIFNMFIWHALIILAVQYLSSGRSAILGYTMPIFSAVLGAWPVDLDHPRQLRVRRLCVDTAGPGAGAARARATVDTCSTDVALACATVDTPMGHLPGPRRPVVERRADVRKQPTHPP